MDRISSPPPVISYFLFCVHLLVSCFLSLSCFCPYHPFRPCLFCLSACFQYVVSLIYFSFFFALFLPFPLALLFNISSLFSVRSVLFLTLSLSPIRCRSHNQFRARCTGHKHELRSSPRVHVCRSQGPFPHSLLSSLTVDRASISHKFPVCYESVSNYRSAVCSEN